MLAQLFGAVSREPMAEYDLPKAKTPHEQESVQP
jgi:hypothetical protein